MFRCWIASHRIASASEDWKDVIEVFIFCWSSSFFEKILSVVFDQVWSFLKEMGGCDGGFYQDGRKRRAQLLTIKVGFETTLPVKPQRLFDMEICEHCRISLFS